MADEPIKPVENRKPDGTFGPGNNANPLGRPKGKTMKEFARDFLLNMDEKAKEEWLKTLDPAVVWRMAEGNPHETKDITSGGKPLPILGNVSDNLGHEENSETEKKN